MSNRPIKLRACDEEEKVIREPFTFLDLQGDDFGRILSLGHVWELGGPNATVSDRIEGGSPWARTLRRELVAALYRHPNPQQANTETVGAAA